MLWQQETVVSDSAIPVKGTSSQLPSNEGRVCPLSYAQQRLWLIYQMEPDNPSYNLPLGLRLRGELNAAVLEDSLREILKRHEALRTRFIVQHGEPLQEILPEPGFRLSTFSFSHIPQIAQEEEIRKAARDEAQKIFDLHQGPLFRARL